MATTAWVAIRSITLDSTAPSVTFSSIPATYRDLIVVVAGATTNDEQTSIRFNGDTGSNYSWVQMGADPGSGVFSSSQSSQNRVRIGYSSTSQGSHITQIMDYSATDKHKTTLSRSNKAASDIRGIAGRWASASAVTSVSVIQDSGSFAVGTTFTLYGSNRL